MCGPCSLPYSANIMVFHQDVSFQKKNKVHAKGAVSDMFDVGFVDWVERRAMFIVDGWMPNGARSHIFDFMIALSWFEVCR